MLDARTPVGARPRRPGTRHGRAARPAAPDPAQFVQAQEALRQSEEKYRQLVEGSDAIIFSIDRRGVFQFMNTTAAAALRGKPEDFIGRKMAELFPPDIARLQMRVLRGVLRTGQPALTEDQTVLNGQPRWYRLHHVPVRGADGRPRFVQSVGVDVTDKKLAEEQVLSLQRQVESVLAATGVVLDIVDGDHNVLFVDPHQRRRLGDPAGRKCHEYFFGSSKPCPNCGTMQAMRLKHRVVHERWIARTRRWMQVTSMPYQDAEGAWRVAETQLDITDLKQAQEALKASEERLRAILGSLHGVLLVMLDGGGRRLFVQIPKELERKYGIRAKDLLGRSLFDSYPEPVARQRVAEMRRVMRTGRPVRVEILMPYPNGEFWQEVTYSPVRGRDGRIEGVLAVADDITDRKAALDALRASDSTARAMLNATAERAVLLDVKGVVQAANETAARSFGLKMTQLLGRSIYDLMPPELARTRRRAVRRVVRQGKSWHVADERNGRILDCHVYPIFDHGSRVSRLAVFVRDITEQKRAENVLIASKLRMQHLFASSPSIIYTREVGGEYGGTFISENVRAVLGYEPARFLGKPAFWQTRIHPEDWTRVQAMAAQVVKKGAASYEYRFRDAAGKYRWMHNSARVVRDRHGRPIEIVGSWTDITDEKATADALLQAERRAKAMLDSATERALLLDLKSHILAINETAARAFHSTPERLIGRRLLDLVPPDLARRWRASYREVARTRRPVRYADQREGRWLDTTITPVFDAAGKVVGLAVFARDTTDQKDAEDALRAAKQRLQSIIDNTFDTIFQVDFKGSYTMASRSAERMTGYPLERLIGMNMRELVAPECRSLVFDRLARRIAGEKLELPFTFEIIHRDGQRRTVELTTSPVHEGGRLVAVQGIARDITERKRAEEALRQAHVKLLEAREGERKRLAGELHDSVGQGLVALLLATRSIAVDGEEGSPVARAAQRAATMCESLIQEVRGISRGLYPPTLEHLGLCSALHQLQRDFARLARIALRCEVPPDARLPAPVEIAFFRIAQEAVNNALRHGQPEQIRIRVAWRRGEAILTVSDNGRGFDTRRPRSGLGLAMMRERAESIGGRLEIASRRGQTRISVIACASGA